MIGARVVEFDSFVPTTSATLYRTSRRHGDRDAMYLWCGREAKKPGRGLRSLVIRFIGSSRLLSKITGVGRVLYESVCRQIATSPSMGRPVI
jgi:hypothetical protein